MEKTRAKKRPSRPVSKLCVKCGEVLQLGDFYSNKDWVTHSYRDAWCKECAAKHCVDKESMRQYCIQNNRKWMEACWERAADKAQYVVVNDPDYINPKSKQEKRDKILEKATASQYISMMNLAPYYYYTENMNENGMYTGDDSMELGEDDPEEITKKTPVYSKVWRGTYTPEQIELLEEEYAQLEEDFVLDNASIRDYARKVAKASLNADLAEDRFRRGEISFKEYKEAVEIFDSQSKSSNFAACRRKPGESSGLGVLGEIILRVELSGALNDRKDEFPKDQIDLIMEDYYHAFEAAGLRGEL